jgi:hypothetical protein
MKFRRVQEHGAAARSRKSIERCIAASSCRAIRIDGSAQAVHAAMAGDRISSYSRRQRQGMRGERFPAVRAYKAKAGLKARLYFWSG